MDSQTHDFDVTLDELIWCEGMEGMNEILDAALESAGVHGIAADISYEVRGIRPDEPSLITIRATFQLDEF